MEIDLSRSDAVFFDMFCYCDKKLAGNEKSKRACMKFTCQDCHRTKTKYSVDNSYVTGSLRAFPVPFAFAIFSVYEKVIQKKNV
jgi:hypothetical protein